MGRSHRDKGQEQHYGNVQGYDFGMLLDEALHNLKNPTASVFAYWREHFGDMRLEKITPEQIALLRYYLGRRRNQMILAAVLLGVGAYFNWGWFVAAGIAPLLLDIAPCAVMGALGLCMRHGKSNATKFKPGDLTALAQLRARLGYSTDSTETGGPNAAVTPIDPISSVKADDRT